MKNRPNTLKTRSILNLSEITSTVINLVILCGNIPFLQHNILLLTIRIKERKGKKIKDGKNKSQKEQIKRKRKRKDEHEDERTEERKKIIKNLRTCLDRTLCARTSCM